jgi:hypothetical protein
MHEGLQQQQCSQQEVLHSEHSTAATLLPSLIVFQHHQEEGKTHTKRRRRRVTAVTLPAHHGDAGQNPCHALMLSCPTTRLIQDCTLFAKELLVQPVDDNH